MNEVFAERRYAYDLTTKTLTLVSRTKPYASIHDLEAAMSHVDEMVTSGSVSAFIRDEKDALETTKVNIHTDTICVHSDSAIALDLVKRLEQTYVAAS